MNLHLKKIVPILIVAGWVSGCGGNTDFAQLGGVIYEQIRTSVGSDSISREKAAAVPYATLGARIGGGGETMMVLSTASGADRLWLDAARAGVITRDGRVVRTVGLGHNLDGFQSSQTSAATPSAAGEQHYLYDFWDRRAFGVSINCSRHETGTETIVTIGVHRLTRHVVEDCKAPQVDWTFQNEFWLDSTSGYVWKSKQYVHPDLDPLTLEILRPDMG